MSSSILEDTSPELQREMAVETNLPPRTAKSLLDHCREYARERPEMAALWCFGLGFVLGWKLKPW